MKNKMYYKLIYIYLLLVYSQILLCQQVTEPVPIFNSDYQAFREEPEDKLYPHLQFFEPGDLDFSISLPFMNFDYLISDSSLLIDTIYFYGFDNKYMEYRRRYSYDDSFRVKSVIAEAFLEDKWNLHQITCISYNKNGNIVQINYGRYEEKFDTININYLYNKNGLLLEEFASGLNNRDSSLDNGWKKSYFYKDNDLVKYTFEKIGKPNWYESDSVKSKYNQANLLIMRTDFTPDVYADSSQFIWSYNNEGQLIEYQYLTFRRSDTLSGQATKYGYNENGKIIREMKVGRDEYDNYPNQFEWEYIYNDIGRLDSICQTGKILLDESDSMLFIGTSTFNYDSNGFLSGSQMSGKYKDKFWGIRIIYTRNSNDNVSFARKETLAQGIWKQGPSMRIVYKRR